MNKNKILYLVLLVITASVALPIYGKEFSLKKQGNMKGFEEQICNMKEDYLFLENELQRLLSECK